MAKKNGRICYPLVSNRTQDSVNRGKSYVGEILKLYGDITLNQIADVEAVEPVSETWKDRPKSNIVKWLMDKSGRSLEEIAESLGCKPSYLNNKLHRDSFSLDDMIIVAYVCGYAITITSNNPDDEERSTFQIDVREYFGSSNPDALRNLYEYEKRMKIQKKAEYDALKARLEQMKTEYGFED